MEECSTGDAAGEGVRSAVPQTGNHSLKDELQSAQRVRQEKYGHRQVQGHLHELSIVKAKPSGTWASEGAVTAGPRGSGEAELEEVDRGGYDIMKSKSNPDILKMAAAAAKRSERTMRSKSLKEGLTPEQRLHLFDNKDAKEF
ncbi:hypothetical protein WMY93_009041 [Mugilogobius chulae]|uniref:Uncharacterized protein n=1 Tax=Mugilogobius chulae TaxID=88201 RepID=A0AAW0PNX0_9GOBI